ncbi:hypothetical protein CTRI78_v009179 [Colletotrichum trifolii]|uniref:Uncharacterized protein n=1 Tax=Colletotrichum trifolii TaxID=5466 RepID=A0A4R8QRC9_COLTR|nr:hypothetical protein CTRI78_v009179 [Colletotrichum trifolii]
MATVPWGETPWDELDVARNCSAYADYAAWVVTGGREPAFPVVASFWRAVVPEANSTRPSNHQIIDWHEWVRLNQTVLSKQVGGIAPCRPELCRVIGSEVDSGLAGVGLLASHGVETVLLTIYCFFAVLRGFKGRKTSTSVSEKPSSATVNDGPGLYGRINEALRATTYDLFAAAAFLSFGIQATVIYYQVSPTAHRHNSSLQLIASAFAFYPLAAMLPLVLDSFRRIWLKGAVLIGLFVIHTAAWVLCTNSAQEDFVRNSAAIDLCPRNHPAEPVIQAAMFTMAAMIWMPPLFGLCLGLVLCFYRCNNRKMWQAGWLRKVSGGAVVLYAVFNFVCMWGAFVILVVFFGGSTLDVGHVWSLGQSLALTPWLPVLMEVASILFFGTENGFVGRLPLEFRVVRKEEALDRQERDGFLDETQAHGGSGL